MENLNENLKCFLQSILILSALKLYYRVKNFTTKPAKIWGDSIEKLSSKIWGCGRPPAPRLRTPRYMDSEVDDSCDSHHERDWFPFDKAEMDWAQQKLVTTLTQTSKLFFVCLVVVSGRVLRAYQVCEALSRVNVSPPPTLLTRFCRACRTLPTWSSGKTLAANAGGPGSNPTEGKICCFTIYSIL